MTDWIYRNALIVAEADRAEADSVATDVVGADQTGTFSIPLSSDGSEPATHFGCYSAVTAEMLVAMQHALLAGRLPTLRYYRLEASDQTLVATNSQSAETGSAWGWEQSLSDAGLSVVVTTEDIGGPID